MDKKIGHPKSELGTPSATIAQTTSSIVAQGKPQRKLTPVKAIRSYCLGCCCESPNEVRLCPSKKCCLYPYRLGHRPKDSQLVPEENSRDPQITLI